MTQEEKALLLKDLCARLPYSPMVEYKGETYNVLGIVHGRLALCKPFMSHTLDECPLVKEVKPYLFPMSSITETIKDEIYQESGLYDIFEDNQIHIEVGTNFTDICKLFNILNKHHIDYKGLIPIGLAIDATDKNIYYL